MCQCFRLLGVHSRITNHADFKKATGGGSILISNKESKDTFLAGRERNTGEYNFPCGGKDHGECCVIRTAIRETFEEVKVNITADMIKGAFINRHPTRNMVTLFLVCHLPSRFDLKEINTKMTAANRLPPSKFNEMTKCDFVAIGTGECVGPESKFYAANSGSSRNTSKFVKRICGEIKSGAIKW
jgi:hypothetical protein